MGISSYTRYGGLQSVRCSPVGKTDVGAKGGDEDSVRAKRGPTDVERRDTLAAVTSLRSKGEDDLQQRVTKVDAIPTGGRLVCR